MLLRRRPLFGVNNHASTRFRPRLPEAAVPSTSSSSPLAGSGKKTASIADSFPSIAQMWVRKCNGSSVARPTDCPISSVKLVSWSCPACGEVFQKKVCDMIKDKGECPMCQGLPSSGAEPCKVGKPFGNRNMEPMLASTLSSVQDTIDAKEVLYWSPKLDGIRCVVSLSHVTGHPLFMSRQGHTLKSCWALEPHLLPVFRKDPTAVLDGEIYIHGLPFGEISAACRATTRPKKVSLVGVQQRFQLHVFDMMYSMLYHGQPAESIPFNERHAALKLLMRDAIGPSSGITYTCADGAAGLSSGVFVVPCEEVLLADVNEVCAKAVAQGFEGAMVRRNSFGYEFGRRSRGLLKVKFMQDAEFVITGFIEGCGRLVGHLGSFKCATKKGHTFYAAPSCSSPEKKKLWENRKELIGKALTVQFQELSAHGVPRFPIAKAVRGSADGKDWM